MKTISYQRSQIFLAATFLLVLVITIALFFLGYSKRFYYASEFQDLLLASGKLFGANLAVVFGAFLATQDSKVSEKRVPIAKIVTSIIVVAIWGLIIVARVSLFVMDAEQDETVNTLKEFLEAVPQTFSFLVTGIVTFFFLKEGTK